MEDKEKEIVYMELDEDISEVIVGSLHIKNIKKAVC